MYHDIGVVVKKGIKENGVKPSKFILKIERTDVYLSKHQHRALTTEAHEAGV